MRTNWIRIITILQFVLILILTCQIYISLKKKDPPTAVEVTKTRKSRMERLSNYDQSMLTRLDELIARKADSRDPELIALVREVMDPPAVYHSHKLSHALAKTPQADIIDPYLKNMTNGFFVEAGGLDGESSSNSLFFEMRKNWKGLVIEADPLFYTQILGKNRRCWSINACLSPTSHVTKMRFIGSMYATGRLVLEKEEQPNKKAADEKISLFTENLIIPCFPLETLLLALNQTKVDFFSLDVEGVEMDILQSLDYQRLDIKTLAVEYTHGNKSAYVPFMKSKGYKLIKELIVANYITYANDFIFAKSE